MRRIHFLIVQRQPEFWRNKREWDSEPNLISSYCAYTQEKSTGSICGRVMV